MTGEQCAAGASFADLLDYWVGDLDQASAERVEAHVFECSECADRLADIATIAPAVAEAVRGARVQSIVTDAVLNKLSREGVRVRTYALEAGTFVPCAIWPEDDLVVSRLKGDFSGYDELTLVLKADEGRELSRNTEIPLLSGTHEIITATSAAHLRQLPSMRLRMIVSGKRGGAEHVIAEYGLEHGGAMSR
jgi:Putative zinc-finger